MTSQSKFLWTIWPLVSETIKALAFREFRVEGCGLYGSGVLGRLEVQTPKWDGDNKGLVMPR